jgi:hypothetical protein
MASIIVIRVDFDHAILETSQSASLLPMARCGVVDVVVQMSFVLCGVN